MISFTADQQKVIDTHNCNVLVSAAAGSGKTAVLVERIIRMICDEAHPVDIDRLLIVTFTNAAAAEMRERISLGITRELALHPESDHIQKQAALLHNAQITTIDSFCLFLIRNHFNEIGLDPAFRVADQGEIKLMQVDVLRELLEEKFAEKNPDFLYCVEYFCPNGRESVLEQHILNISGYASSYPWPLEWLAERKEDYGAESVEELEQSDYGRYLVEHLRAMTEGCLDSYYRLLGICEEPDGPYMYGELVEQELAQIERLTACKSLQEYASRLPAVSFGRLSSKKDESVNSLKREQAKALRAQVKDILQGLTERFFATPLELAAQQSARCAKPVGVLIDLVLEFMQRMQECKQEKKLLDFSDMEHYALDILLEREGEEVRPSQVALEYRQYFQEILIDEYQDSNLVQEYLLRAISGEEQGNFNRFMVGDVKQSIYKFRLARPELFLEKYDCYTPEGSCRRIDLSRNFRSRSQVVDTVNGVFSRIMTRQTGGIEYDDRAALYAGAQYPENPDCFSELLLVEKPTGQEKGQTAGQATGQERGQTAGQVTGQQAGQDIEQLSGKTVLTAKEAEGLAIARRIQELREGFQVTDKQTGELRPVQYRDIVILLRTNSGWDEVFKKVLEEQGIPVYVTTKTGYFAAQEVQELLQFLRVLDNPRQDIPLFGVLKSVFGGFSETEIALLRSRAKEGDLYEALKQCAGRKNAGEESQYGNEDNNAEEAAGQSQIQSAEEAVGHSQERSAEEAVEQSQEQDILRERAAAFLDKLDAYRKATVYLPIRDLLQLIVNDHDYLDYVTALPAGSKRRANVEMLFTKASDFEKTSYFGLFHFIRYIEQLEKYDVDYGEAELLDENADVVRIMSIHKSKGLEFPVTFVSGLSKRFNMQDANQSLIVDVDMGIGTDYVDPERRIRNKTLRRQVLARKMKEDNLAEEMRVLYVAMTRPKEKLIMTACLEKAQEKWENLQESAGERKNATVMEKRKAESSTGMTGSSGMSASAELIREAEGKAGRTAGSALGFHEYMEAASYLDFILPVIKDTGTQVTVLDVEDMAAAGSREQVKLFERRESLAHAEEYADSAQLEMLRQKFSYEYPFRALEKLYTKTTVSELKIAAMEEKDEAAYHIFEEQPVVPYLPRFRAEEEKVSGTVRGNAFHKVMELMDFARMYAGMAEPGKEGIRKAEGSKEQLLSYEEFAACLKEEQLSENLKQWLAQQTAEGRLCEEYYQALNLSKLVHFLEQPIAWRMWCASERGQLYREQPFVYGIDATRLDGKFPEEEKVMIQGIIDVFFVEDGKLVLLDYKTDVVKSPQELWNRYETQLDYYEEALCRLMDMEMKERTLYSFYLERCV